MSTFLFHPPGITLKIVGTDCGTHGRSCYAHNICGSLLAENVVICLRVLQIVLMAKRDWSLQPTMFQMELIPVALVF